MRLSWGRVSPTLPSSNSGRGIYAVARMTPLMTSSGLYFLLSPSSTWRIRLWKVNLSAWPGVPIWPWTRKSFRLMKATKSNAAFNSGLVEVEVGSSGVPVISFIFFRRSCKIFLPLSGKLSTSSLSIYLLYASPDHGAVCLQYPCQFSVGHTTLSVVVPRVCTTLLSCLLPTSPVPLGDSMQPWIRIRSCQWGLLYSYYIHSWNDPSTFFLPLLPLSIVRISWSGILAHSMITSLVLTGLSC